MYSTSSSSSQHSTPPSTTTTTTNNNNNLTRYDSAPTSFLSTVAETVSGLGLGLPHHNHNHNQHQQFYSGSRDSLAPESTHLQHQQQHQHQHQHSESRNTLTLLHENSYDNSPVKAAGTTTASSNNLIRHSSSPANFLHQLTSDLGYCNSNQGGSVNGHNLSRLGTQLSFTKQDHHSLSQISELNGCGGMLEGMSSHDNNNNSHTTLKRASTSSSQPRSSSGFSLSAWEDSNDGFSFSGPSSTKRNKSINDDILNGLVSMESQDIAFEMTSMDRLMQIPQDSVPCKIRAKRGFATHPRSIAERERRTRISGKLKKLQDLVPNMDKQTSYADMLDLAVQHIKGLQNEVQKLNGELDRCTCGCKENVQH